MSQTSLPLGKLDPVQIWVSKNYQKHASGAIVVVEGTTDEDLFQRAVQLEREATGIDLLGKDLTILAAGVGNAGGAKEVARGLNKLRTLANPILMPDGRWRYRIIGLFDDDTAGKSAIRFAQDMDIDITEYRDVFRLQPVMPILSNLDPTHLKNVFEKENAPYKQLPQWELEDLASEDCLNRYVSETQRADDLRHSTLVNGKSHREFTTDGKRRFNHFLKTRSTHEDLCEVISALRALRCYLRLKEPSE